MQAAWDKPMRSAPSSAKDKTKRKSRIVSDTESDSDSNDGSSSSGEEEEEEDDVEAEESETQSQHLNQTDAESSSSSDEDEAVKPPQPSTSKADTVRIKPGKSASHGKVTVIPEEEDDPTLPDLECELKLLLPKSHWLPLRKKRPLTNLSMEEIVKHYGTSQKYQEAKDNFINFVRQILKDLKILHKLPKSSDFSKPGDPNSPPHDRKSTKRKGKGPQASKSPPQKRESTKEKTFSPGPLFGKFFCQL